MHCRDGRPTIRKVNKVNGDHGFAGYPYHHDDSSPCLGDRCGLLPHYPADSDTESVDILDELQKI